MNQDKVDDILNKYQGNPGSLIQILLEVQHENHWLPKEILERLGKDLNIPLTRIYKIATFYKAFSLVPKGRHIISVCMGTACHVRGAPRILDAVQKLIGIGPGETDSALKFSIETVNCLGCCALGPVMVIDEKYHGNVQVSKVEKILAGYE